MSGRSSQLDMSVALQSAVERLREMRSQTLGILVADRRVHDVVAYDLATRVLSVCLTCERSAARTAGGSAAAATTAALGCAGRRVVRRHRRELRHGIDRSGLQRAPPRLDLADRIDGDGSALAD